MKMRLILLVLLVNTNSYCIQPNKVQAASTDNKKTFIEKYKKWLVVGTVTVSALIAAVGGLAYKYSRDREALEAKKQLMGNEMSDIEKLRYSSQQQLEESGKPVSTPPPAIEKLPNEILSAHIFERLVAQATTLPQLQEIVGKFALASSQFNQAAKTAQRNTNEKDALRAVDAKRIELVNELIKIIQTYKNKLLTYYFRQDEIRVEKFAFYESRATNLSKTRRYSATELAGFFDEDIKALRDLSKEVVVGDRYKLIYQILTRDLNYFVTFFNQRLICDDLFGLPQSAIELFLNNGVNANDIKDAYGKSLLEIVIAREKIDFAELLLDKYNANVNAKSNIGTTPLVAALVPVDVSYHLEMNEFALKLIHHYHAEIYTWTMGIGKYKLLHEAILTCDPQIVDIIISHDPAINELNYKNMTPLMVLLSYKPSIDIYEQVELYKNIATFATWFITVYNPDVLPRDKETANDALGWAQRLWQMRVYPLASSRDQNLSIAWQNLIEILKQKKQEQLKVIKPK